MKYIIVLGDGMADEPIPALNGKTPLQVANIPVIDKMAKEGITGELKTVPDEFPPGSEIANLSVMGYNVAEVFEGRGSLEAAAMGVELNDGDLALRCNLICLKDGNIKNHSAGHISDAEAAELVEYLNANLKEDSVHIHAGVSYRHLMVIKGGHKALKCKAPHDAVGVPFKDILPEATKDEAKATAKLLQKLVIKSQQLMANHPVNQKRVEAGKDPANSIWPWSPGYRPAMKTMSELYGVGKTAVISAVDLIRGIGVYAGMDVIYVEGATGLYDTNYEGKTQATINALKDHDLVYLHIEASDEAGHEGDHELKIRTIEYLNDRVLKALYDMAKSSEEPVTIAILPDHPTSCNTKTHTRDNVPFIIWRSNLKMNDADRVDRYDEYAVKKGDYGLLVGNEFIKELFKH